ncbi:hypothetical protein [Priestia megaterium]|uniref:hypothetical protein n=1 Tax=Priestia megaterium TaxID=1404 RepID=UPI001A93ACF8|nr:hypothetical protein [Priestia megaterium]QSX20028.1 hypothetical protein J0P05_22765 [Priestia megaterium]
MNASEITPIQLSADYDDVIQASNDFKKIIQFALEQGWSEERIYRVAKLTLALLEKNN